MKKLARLSSISGYLTLAIFAIVIPPLISFSSSTCVKPFELSYKLFSFLASLIIVGIADFPIAHLRAFPSQLS